MNILKVRWNKDPVGPYRIEMLVERYPEFKYRQDGDRFVADDCGFLSEYEYAPGKTHGGGRQFTTLRMEDGTKRVFGSDLWFRVPKDSVCVRITTDHDSFMRSGGIMATHITKALYQEVTKCLLSE